MSAYEGAPHDVPLRALLASHGGLCRRDARLEGRGALGLVARLWAGQLLGAHVAALRSRVLLRGMSADRWLVSPDGGIIRVATLEGVALVGARGEIASAPDLGAAMGAPTNETLAPEDVAAGLAEGGGAARALGGAAEPRAVWAFGCVLFELLAGVKPSAYGAALFSHADARGLDPSELVERDLAGLPSGVPFDAAGSAIAPRAERAPSARVYLSLIHI